MTRVTRWAIFAAALALSSTSAYAQSLAPPPASCWSVAVKGVVLVTKDDGTVQKGTLVCLGSDHVVLAGAGTVPLDSIRQITKQRDGILDGVLKGASIGLAFLIGCGFDCDAGIVARMTLTYAAIGGAMDAAQGNNPTIYRRESGSPSLGWRIRF